MNQENKNKKNNTTKYVLISLGVVALGTGGYFLVKHLGAKNNKSTTTFEPTTFIPEQVSQSKPPQQTSSGSSQSSRNVFPLKKGSKGELVKQLQLALIKRYGTAILPKYGADGDFGSELQSALMAKGLTTTVTPETYSNIVSKSSGLVKQENSGSIAVKDIANGLHLGIYRDNFPIAFQALRQIKSVRHYVSVSTLFKMVRIGGVRKTIVNALLTKFNSPNEKKKLNSQFAKIGLKFNGRQWSLSGLNGVSRQIKTIRKCKVWNVLGESMIAEKETILGELLSTGRGITEFSTLDDKILFTKTSCIAYV